MHASSAEQVYDRHSHQTCSSPNQGPGVGLVAFRSRHPDVAKAETVLPLGELVKALANA